MLAGTRDKAIGLGRRSAPQFEKWTIEGDRGVFWRELRRGPCNFEGLHMGSEGCRAERHRNGLKVDAPEACAETSVAAGGAWHSNVSTRVGVCAPSGCGPIEAESGRTHGSRSLRIWWWAELARWVLKKHPGLCVSAGTKTKHRHQKKDG